MISNRSRLGALLVPLLLGLTPLYASGAAPQPPEPPDDEADLDVRESVAVQPTATDADIAARLTRVLEASGWFQARR